MGLRAVPRQRFAAPKHCAIAPTSKVFRSRPGTEFSGTVTNAGTAPTPPTFTYTSTGSYASVYFANATSGKAVWLTLPLVNGDVLTVDFSARTVTLNGSTVANVVTAASRWWDLEVGANTVRSNVPATVKHRDAFG